LHPPAFCEGGVKRGRSAPVCARRMAKRKSYNSYYVKTLISHCFITLFSKTKLCARRKPQHLVSALRCGNDSACN